TLFALVLPHPPHSTPFPYTTLFRSRRFTNDLPESLGQMGLIGKTELGRDAGDSHVAFRQQLLRPIDALRHLPLQWCLAGRLLEDIGEPAFRQTDGCGHFGNTQPAVAA